MRIDERIRQGVIEALPEAKEIQNKELRERLYDAWRSVVGHNNSLKRKPFAKERRMTKELTRLEEGTK